MRRATFGRVATHLVGRRNYRLSFDLSSELQPGDSRFFTGTPEGVGAVVTGDLMKRRRGPDRAQFSVRRLKQLWRKMTDMKLYS